VALFIQRWKQSLGENEGSCFGHVRSVAPLDGTLQFGRLINRSGAIMRSPTVARQRIQT